MIETPDLQRLRFRQAALSILLDQSLIAFVAIAVNAAVYVSVSWNIVNRAHLMLWLGLVAVSTAWRVYFHRKWRAAGRPFKTIEVERITRGIFWGAGSSAVLWGAMGSLLLVPDSSLHFAMTIFILAGLTAGAVGAYSINFRLTLLFAASLIGPLVIRLLAEQSPPHLMMALLAALFLVLMILVARNVSRQSRRAVELGLQNEDLIHRLSDATHEIRAPVATIAGFAEVLVDSPESTAAVKNYAQIIRRNSSYLKRLVDNVLMLSKTESGTLQDNWEQIGLREQIHLAADVIGSRLKDKKISLHVHLDPDVPESIESQPLKVQQILVNLLTNAAKFTDGGQIMVTARAQDSDVLICVRDTGIGIQSENQNHLFRPFWREDRKEVKSQEGSGLGLALSRSLARSMGGDLRLLESAPGRGSVFELCLHGANG